MTSIIARKIGMTQITDEQGIARAVTLLHVPKNVVTDMKTRDRDGYDSTQIGISASKKINTTIVKRNKINKISENINYFKESNLVKGKTIGDEIDLEQFASGDLVEIIGIGKGKGFSGTVKRHGFTIGPKSHGSHNMRQPGSIGSAYPQRVVKGRKMPGRMGSNKVTLKNLMIESVDKENAIISVMGNVPGIYQSLLLINKTK